VKRGYLGITLESVHEEFAKVYGMTEAKGAIVTFVAPNEPGQSTPAATAGIQANDIIVEFEGQPVLSAQDLIQRVASTPVGQQVKLGFLRDVNGKLERKNVTVALGERPPSRDWVEPPKNSSNGTAPKGNTLRLGVTLAEITPQVLADRQVAGTQGIYVKDVDPNGLIAEIRIPPNNLPALVEGDTINRINRVQVNSLADFQRVLNTLKVGDPIVLNITRLQPNGKGDRLVPLIVQFTYQ
ncbi:MAG TPA: PDZ domain-containing protein, partial [Pyrinomonadaceae bacterium]|nr:PDZ domain-containing protein [Pyrinomonadaceae bacterium]